MGWGGQGYSPEEVQRLKLLIRSGSTAMVTTEPGALQVAAFAAAREAEKELAEWRERAARLADPDEGRWQEALRETREALVADRERRRSA